MSKEIITAYNKMIVRNLLTYYQQPVFRKLRCLLATQQYIKPDELCLY